MKNILTFLAIVLFTLNISAQETTTIAQEKPEKSCSSHDAHSKKMTKEEIAICKEKCKAEGKKCNAKDNSKCKKDDKKCSTEEKTEGKKCCAKKH
ncbi:hypothetical protein [Flavobacterium sp.]|uniref:hypothetical protein n=1 Tax=Flavobacterium sp. TaxID=239 RepID=UPI0038FCE49A